MSIERRLAKRYPTQEKVYLFLRDKSSSRKLTERVSANLIDISLAGAGIRLALVVIDRNHIFYASLDASDKILCLEFPLITSDDGEPFVIPIHPVWLDRSFNDLECPFRMGVEFLEKFPNDIFQIVLRDK